MRYEKSCGFVVYKQVEGVLYYLVILSSNGDLGFPKGHVELGESEYETAIRELKEETNVEVEILEGFRYEFEYKLPYKKNVMKQCVYFVGKCVSEDICCLEKEVLDAKFVSLERAVSALTFDDTRKLLKEADAYIKSHIE